MSLSSLQVDCISYVLSFTTLQEACRLSVVSSLFKSAAEYDGLWGRFLPHDYKSIISTSNNPQPLESVSSKKQLYLSLSDNPILIEDGKKSFSLEKKSGKKCYIISARELVATRNSTPGRWGRNSDPTSRFAEVGELLRPSSDFLAIRGKIDINMLSPATWYTACLVFKLAPKNYGLFGPAVVLVGAGRSRRRTSFNQGDHYPKERGDGWLEVELGDFFNKEGEDGNLKSKVLFYEGFRESGFIVEGMEIRPKKGI